MFYSIEQLEEIIQGGLEGNEYVSLLSWVMNIYPGPELMSHPDLQVDLSSLEPLINERSLKELENEYLKVRLSSKISIFGIDSTRFNYSFRSWKRTTKIG